MTARWWYNYFTSERARAPGFTAGPWGADAGTAGFINAATLDVTWVPLYPTFEFCPMVISPNHNNPTEIGWLGTECPNAMHLLGPTEPDQLSPPPPTTYMGYPVADVLQLWNDVYEPWRSSSVSALNPLGLTGRRLVSPACSQTHPSDVAGGWFDQFMTGVASNGFHIDAIALHVFGNYSGAGLVMNGAVAAQVDTLRKYMQRVWDKYQRPMWPEIAMFEASSNMAQLAQFNTAAVDMFRQLNQVYGTTVVERWDYWPMGPNIYTDPSSGGLYDAAGVITPVGTGFKILAG